MVRVLERLGKDDLQSAVALVIPMIPSLVERSRLIVPKTLIERSIVRGVDTRSLARALESAYDFNPARRLFQILNLDNDSTLDDEQQKQQSSKQSSYSANSRKIHGSLLAQTMLEAPGPLSEIVFTSLLAQPTDSLMSISKDPITSHVIQQALTGPTATPPFRRQLTNRFQGQLKDLALDASGSHVVDALWPATKDIFFVKERMAQELVQNELAFRDSFVGRAVWRNWSMDLYKRRRGEWIARAKDQTHDDGNGGRPKSKIDLARAHFAVKAAQEEAGKTPRQSAKAKAGMATTGNSRAQQTPVTAK